MGAFHRFKTAARIRGNHEQMLAELDAIYSREQALRPEAVVEHARNKKSALHGHFEWNDKAAATAYRLRQAGDIIRAVVTVEVDDEGKSKREFRALVSVNVEDVSDEEPTKTYVRTEDALAVPGLRSQVLAEASRDVDVFQRKWAHLTELAEVNRAMSEFRERHSDLTLV